MKIEFEVYDFIFKPIPACITTVNNMLIRNLATVLKNIQE